MPALANANGRIWAWQAKNRIASGQSYTFKLLDSIDGFNSLICTGAALVGDQGETMTFTRASSSACECANGSLVTLSNNQVCVESRGVLNIGQQIDNLVPWTEDLSHWSTSNATVGTSDQYVAPDGTTTAETCTSTSNGGYCYIQATGTFNGSQAVASVFVRTTSGTKTITVQGWDVGSAGFWGTADYTVGSTAYTRVFAGGNGSVVAVNTHQLRIYPGGTGSTGTLVVWGGNITSTITSPAPYISNAGTLASRAVEKLSIGPAGADWPLETGCARITYTPLSDNLTGTLLYTPQAGNNAFMWQLSPFDGTKQRWNVFNNAVFNFADSSSGASNAVAYVPMTARVTWTGTGQYASFYKNGTNYGLNTDASGTMGDYRTGGATQLYIGQANGASPLLGWYRNILFDVGAGGCE